MSSLVIGLVGLGNMGRELAANVVASGCEVISHDLAGPERNVTGATFVDTITDVAQRADVVVLSLPDGVASGAVAREISQAAHRRCEHVVDTSTVGVRAAASIAALLREYGVGYVDSPVSGGPAGARAGTLAVMYAGADQDCVAVEPVLAALSDRRFRVGDRPGLGQAVKLANNFLSATALAATSEAIAFGEAVGVDMSTMLTVLNASSGSSTATSDKFPNHVVTQRYASGFTNSLMAKDLGLYLAEVEGAGAASTIGTVTKSVWERFAAATPGADFTRIYPFVRDS